MKTSVALSTYNGAQFIEELFDSLRAQTVLFDEVVIRDDCSADDTPQIIKQYLISNTVAGWRFGVADENGGYKRSFYELLYQTKNELVYLCDQDDVWHIEKNEIMQKAMAANPDIDVLACLVNPIYEDGSITSCAESEKEAGSGDCEIRVRNILSPKALYVTRPGCSYCVRQSFLEEIKPFWNTDLPHDAVLWVLSEVKGTLGLLDAQLVNFRRHDRNASDRRIVDMDSRMSDIVLQEKMLDMAEVFAHERGYCSHDVIKRIQEIRAWLGARRLLLSQRAYGELPRLFSQRELYASRKALCVDVVLSVFPNVRLRR